MDFFFAKEFSGSGTFCKNTWISFQVLRFHRYLRYLPDPALMQLPDVLSPDSVQCCLHLVYQVHDWQILQLPSAFPDRFQRNGIFLLLRTDAASDHSFRTSVSETTRNQDTIYIVNFLIHIFLSFLQNRSSKLYIGSACNSAMFQCLYHTEICIMKLDIFSYHCDLYLFVRISQIFYHCLPVSQIRFSAWKVKTLADTSARFSFSMARGSFI